ncbi:helix-turn-helix domain-containing protein [Lachnoclostridium sp. An169]|uniref:helix-turn-helix domain-containing protein n=1 Tax=Lachnoclostridium sp. An169 TaxID=1965569 RepID=UPI0013A673B2|nr:AraC family transcriptional regulator [Lachnoclostridium sp. An169]
MVRPRRCQVSVRSDPSFADGIVSAVKSQKWPVLFLEEEFIFYGLFKQEKTCCIFGPAARKTIEQEKIRSYKYRHPVFAQTDISYISVEKLSKLLVMAFYHFTGEDVEYYHLPLVTKNGEFSRWTPESDVENYQLEQSEFDRGHNSIETENQIRRIVMEGDMESMKKILSADGFDMNNVGAVAENNAKQWEYMIVSMIVLLSRAAIEGGLNPELSYEMSDVYLRKLEKCKSIEDMMLLGMKAQYEYTEKVHEAKEQLSHLTYIEECKDYIAKNLRKPFKVGDIAPAIGVSRSYLARKFSESEGMTIQQYVMKERCKHAANLLKYSKYPISIISEYFCFSSQSHFGKQFRHFYGMTPNEYRTQNRYIESYSK